MEMGRVQASRSLRIVETAAVTSVILGRELRRARRTRNLTQETLAQRASVNLATVMGLEAGRGTVASLLRVLAALEHRFLQQPNAVAVGQWLAERRRGMGVSQQRLSEQAACSKPSVIQAERSRGHVNTLTSIIVALKLKLTLRPDEGSEVRKGDESPEGSYLGDQRILVRQLLQGDCRRVMEQIPHGSINLIITSPPYNIGKGYTSYTDNLSLDRYREFAREWMSHLPRLLTERGSIWINVGNTRDPSGGMLPLTHIYYPIAKSLGLTLIQEVTWFHPGGMPQTQRFTHLTERWLWLTKIRRGYVWNLDEVRIPHKAKDKRANRLGANPGDMWTYNTVVHGSREKTAHPCQFPVEMVERIVRSCSRVGDVILDPFGGSGSTAVAADRNERGFILIESDPAYHEISRRRVFGSA